MTTNSRFRELAPGVVAEMVATRIEMQYVPKGLDTPEALTATWWGHEFLPVGEGYQRIGDHGHRMVTVLAEHATDTLKITDPVTGQEVTLSAAGAVVWLQEWYDHQHNRDAEAAAMPPPQDESADPFPADPPPEGPADQVEPGDQLPP